MVIADLGKRGVINLVSQRSFVEEKDVVAVPCNREDTNLKELHWLDDSKNNHSYRGDVQPRVIHEICVFPAGDG